jgi:hypothetical protein
VAGLSVFSSFAAPEAASEPKEQEFCLDPKVSFPDESTGARTRFYVINK